MKTMQLSTVIVFLATSCRATVAFPLMTRRCFSLHSNSRLLQYGRVQQRYFARKIGVLDALMNRVGFGTSEKTVAKNERDPGEVQGTSLRILQYPHPLLRKDNEPITDFDDTLKRLAEEMLLLMYAADGVGLAAPQVGINKRLMVFNEDGDPMSKEKEMVLVNPVITAKSNKSVTPEEGCLSFPNIYGFVRRAQWIAVDYQQLDGATVKNKYFEGNNAIIFQHEYDHLDKILFIDRIDGTQREQNSRKLDKLIRKYGPGGIL